MAKLLIIAGSICILFSGYLYRQRTSPVTLRIKSYKENTAVITIKPVNKPSSIEITSLNIHVPILPASIRDGKWETTSEGISHLISSPIPGDTGNSILYGHNWHNLLGKLPRIEPGEEIVIYYSDGSKKAFKVIQAGVVEADQISILDQTQDNRLTLYTCTGFLDLKRFVVVAVLL